MPRNDLSGILLKAVNLFSLIFLIFFAAKKVKARMRYLMDNNKVDNYLGPVWFGFRPMPKGFDSSKVESCADLDKVDATNDKNYTRMNIGIYTFTSGCYFFDHDLKDWASQGCTVSEGYKR